MGIVVVYKPTCNWGTHPVEILWMEEILHQLVTIGSPIKHCKQWDYNGMCTIYQLVQNFATIHSIVYLDEKWSYLNSIGFC